MKWHSKEGRKSEDQPVMAKHSNWALNVGCVRWEHRLKKSLEDWPALIDIPIWAGCTISGNTLLIVCHLCLYPWVSGLSSLSFHLHSLVGFSAFPLPHQGAFPKLLGHPVSLSVFELNTAESNLVFILATLSTPLNFHFQTAPLVIRAQGSMKIWLGTRVAGNSKYFEGVKRCTVAGAPNTGINSFFNQLIPFLSFWHGFLTLSCDRICHLSEDLKILKPWGVRCHLRLLQAMAQMSISRSQWFSVPFVTLIHLAYCGSYRRRWHWQDSIPIQRVMGWIVSSLFAQIHFWSSSPQYIRMWPYLGTVSLQI